MNYPAHPYQIFPLGDSAITIDFGNCIDEAINKEVIARFGQLKQQPIPGMTEAVPAYSSITVYFDIMALKKKIQSQLTAYEWMCRQLEERMKEPVQQIQVNERQMKIPVCYGEEFAMDIQQLAASKNISVEEVIRIHVSGTYRVYMLGFMPGFAYMGELDERIAMPRKPQPVSIAEGSVGIAGRQTGIYPLASPGGWQIIGRTPLKLFRAPLNLPEGKTSDSESLTIPDNEPTLLRAGDTVQFYSITKKDFYEIQNAPSARSGEGVGG